jgi:hypothetical protein
VKYIDRTERRVKVQYLGSHCGGREALQRGLARFE